MKFQGALIEERGVTFGIVIVKQYVLSNKAEADKVIASFQSQIFVGHPVILVAQDGKGVPTYYGRQDLARFMASVPMGAVPWMKYTVG